MIELLQHIKKIAKNSNWAGLFIGTTSFVLGVRLIHDPTWTSKYGIEFDVSQYNIPFAFSMICGGIYSTWVSLKYHPDKNIEALICTQCHQSMQRYQVKDNCPHCGGKLEPLKDFNDRHAAPRDK